MLRELSLILFTGLGSVTGRSSINRATSLSRFSSSRNSTPPATTHLSASCAPKAFACDPSGIVTSVVFLLVVVVVVVVGGGCNSIHQFSQTVHLF